MLKNSSSSLNWGRPAILPIHFPSFGGELGTNANVEQPGGRKMQINFEGTEVEGGEEYPIPFKSEYSTVGNEVRKKVDISTTELKNERATWTAAQFVHRQPGKWVEASNVNSTLIGANETDIRLMDGRTLIAVEWFDWVEKEIFPLFTDKCGLPGTKQEKILYFTFPINVIREHLNNK